MASQANRRFFEELGQLISKTVVVEDISGLQYQGTLLGFDSNNFSVSLGEVKMKGEQVHRIFLAGNIVAKIMALERPFNIDGLKERLERVFPNMVQIYPEAGVIVVMGKIRVNENGLFEGTGPAADRVKDIFNRFSSDI
jgi:small nuclear ribonucleoprotein (snRNP)-like protein